MHLQATDLTLTDKLSKALKKHKGAFIPSKSREPTFSIKHYAGLVQYVGDSTHSHLFTVLVWL